MNRINIDWLVQWAHYLFPRAMALVYLVAFASFYPQIPGLVGARGLEPFAPFFQLVHTRLGARAYYLLPSLAWIHPSTSTLQMIVILGILVSLAALAGLSAGACFAVLWALYLSVVNTGGEFMSFQWDVLLLEAGFLAIFFVPWSWSREKPFAPPRAAVWLVRWLAFRLLFLSGCVKLLSHDPSWRNWTALDVHYQTQPIPNPIAWYMHQAPRWFQRFSLGYMWITELAVPFLIFAPRRVRHAAAMWLIAFQVVLIVTGNYAYFNWLAIALCLPLFDPPEPRYDVAVAGRVQRWACTTLAAIVLPISAMEMAELIGWDTGDTVIQAVAPFHTINSYGLFAAMTTERPEIVIEGTSDGVAWKPYEFFFKPGDPHRPPPFVAPYQPRLDWQMWFAALGGRAENRWVERLLLRLLEGEPAVLALMGDNPFPNHPPQAIRARLYEYRFTTIDEHTRTGDWWVREPKGMYFSEVKLPEAKLPDAPKRPH